MVSIAADWGVIWVKYFTEEWFEAPIRVSAALVFFWVIAFAVAAACVYSVDAGPLSRWHCAVA